MDIALWTASIISSLSLLVWVWLLLGRGGFWRTDQQLRPAADATAGDIEWPAVRIVVPARNEARVLPETLPTLLGQDYPGSFHIVLVDDDSEDGTEEVAKQIASEADLSHRLSVVTGEPLRAGWAGKVWALHQGVDTEREAQPDFFLLTDADIAHPPDVLRGLVLKAQNEGLALVSLMAKLRRSSPWEHMLIPAFVFFFSKLYPFR